MIEFIEETHTYLYNGVMLPSVTQIIRTVLGSSYDVVPEHILQSASEYGTRVHEWLEWFFTNCNKQIYGCTLDELTPPHITETMKLSANQVVQKFKDEGFYKRFECIDCEHPLVILRSCCGTYDMLCKCDGKTVLVDFKTTSKFDGEYLSWQLGFYKKGLEEQGIRVDSCYALWLPKNDLVELIEVKPKSEEEVKEMIEKYHNKKASKHSQETLPF